MDPPPSPPIVVGRYRGLRRPVFDVGSLDRLMSALATGQMFAVETGQMSAVETRQMSDVDKADVFC